MEVRPRKHPSATFGSRAVQNMFRELPEILNPSRPAKKRTSLRTFIRKSKSGALTSP